MENFELHSVPAVAPIRDAADFCRPLAKISGVTLDLQLMDCAVQANALRLQQVVINLISNAIKYTPNGSTISIRSETTTLAKVREQTNEALVIGPPSDKEETNEDVETPVVVVSVSDAGTGIAPGQEGRLFRKFSQLDSEQQNPSETVGQPKGTGLGLNLCLRFTQLMKGNIWVSNNTDGPGSTFSFYLPLVKATTTSTSDTTESSKPTECPPNPQTPSTVETSNLRVLVVDDILINRKVLERMLRKIGVEVVKVAESGEDALLELDKATYDLIISDLQMPGMSGFELSEKIRDKSIETNVVGLTADTSPDLYGQCVASGMVDVIHKPITVVDLHDTLVQWSK